MVPVMLDGTRLRALVVGGGPVGRRRAATLADAGATVTLVAPEVGGDVPANVTVHRRPFAESDLDGVNLVVAATDRAEVNRAVGDACARRGVLCCRADDAAAGAVRFATKIERGPVVAGVVTGSPALSRRVAAAVGETLDRFGPLATATAALRPRLLDHAEALKSLADDAAADVASAGGTAGVLAWLIDRHPDITDLREIPKPRADSPRLRVE